MLPIPQRMVLFEAAKAGDVVALESIFQQHDVIAAVDATELSISRSYPTSTTDEFDHWYFIGRSAPMYTLTAPTYKYQTVVAVAGEANQIEVLAWLFSPVMTAWIPATLAVLWAKITAPSTIHWINAEMLELLLTVGASLFSESELEAKITTLLTRASSFSDEMIQMLLAHGATISPAVLGSVGAFRSLPVSTTLVAEGAFVVGSLALDTLTTSCKADAVSYLMEKGVDCGYGSIVLYAAVRDCQVEITELLLREGFVDVDGRDAQARTALIQVSTRERLGPFILPATPSRRAAVAQVLLNAGADIGLADWDGCTALHHSISREILPVAKTLLEHGANPNSVNHQGETVLDCVSFSGRRTDYASFVLLLLRHGADPFGTSTGSSRSGWFQDRLLHTEAGRAFASAYPQYGVPPM